MSTSIKALSGVGDAMAELLAKLHIHTPTDLLFHLPRGYEDRSRIIPLHLLKLGQSVLIEGTVQSIDHPAGRKPSLAVQVADGHGRITLRFYQVYAGLKD